ncbi:5086_t:CDS:2 [Dentiscutata erythropus]|uniref:5086_t:CDS:1 n=1 Tax=Dentiscutata erythropus TaxID=1348616 RepID=A0A9N9EGG2_9GLOM|nr:5086_t:CDS:2 [Dentiscutata erythropus]
MPDPIWVHFTQLGHVIEFKQKRRECNYYQQQINDALRAAYSNDISTSATAASASTSTVVAFSSLPASLVTTTSSVSNNKVSFKNITRS